MIRDKRTGIQMISEERKEQIEKHGWDLSHDQDYGHNELIKAALFCINQEYFEWPFEWDDEFRDKILGKNRVEQLTRAGAFIAAEIDRIKYEEQLDIDNDPKSYE